MESVMDSFSESEVAYLGVLRALEDNADVLQGNSTMCSAKAEANLKLKQIGILREFKIEDVPLNTLYGYDSWELSSYSRLTYYSEGRSISWEDNGNQPKDEWLYSVSFPTGAYIYGEGYPTKTFNTMFEELKSYNPKYCDTANKALYFDKSNAHKVHNELFKTLEKHRGKVAEEVKQRKINELKAQIDELENK